MRHEYNIAVIDFEKAKKEVENAKENKDGSPTLESAYIVLGETAENVSKLQVENYHIAKDVIISRLVKLNLITRSEAHSFSVIIFDGGSQVE